MENVAFKNVISRTYGPDRSILTSPGLSEVKLTAEDIAEIDYRFEGLRP